MTVALERQSAAVRRTLYFRFNRWLERHTPGGLYRRALIIIIMPVLLMQSIAGSLFIERHWTRVTRDLSKAVASEIAYVVATYEALPSYSDGDLNAFQKRTNDALQLGLTIHRDTKLPPLAEKPFFSLVDVKLSKYVGRFVRKPFWIDTLGQSGFIDVRVQVEPGVIFRFLPRQKRAYASNSHIFFVWMFGSSILLLAIAIVFLRNQIKPILRLADAAQRFGMGREVEDFRPSGATEVQAAAHAFLNMKRRIERHVEQRTAMLAGVSHDIRTILTRFKLELALMEESPALDALRQDVDEMQQMLEGYMAFVRGDEGERAEPTDIREVLNSMQRSIKREGRHISVHMPPELTVSVKPNALRRCIENLTVNAVRHATDVHVHAEKTDKYLLVSVEDNGPGIKPSDREKVFRPFVRLDHARNMDEMGTGLGLSIAIDIAQSHGGDITLGNSSYGGLSAKVRIPL